MLSLVDKDRPKYCWAWNRVYVKSNGRIPCWCDSGEKHTIIHKSLEDSDFINDIVNSEQMCRMRTKILRYSMNYIKECSRCCCMVDHTRGEHSRFIKQADNNINNKIRNALSILDNNIKKGMKDGAIDNIKEIQIEPALPCNLRCPGCMQSKVKNILDTEAKPYILPLDWFKMMILSCVHNDVSVEKITFVGRGEPTLCHQLPDMIGYCRDKIDTFMSMDTNCTQPFYRSYADLDNINCSIDGATNESYAKYRIGGNLDKTIQFMQQCVNANGRCKVTWKYILFDTNDSIEEMNLAQQIAKSIGVDDLKFIVTNFAGGNVTPSKKFINTLQVDNYINSNKIFENCTTSYAT